MPGCWQRVGLCVTLVQRSPKTCLVSCHSLDSLQACRFYTNYIVFPLHLQAWLYSGWLCVAGILHFLHNWATCLKVCLKLMWWPAREAFENKPPKQVNVDTVASSVSGPEATFHWKKSKEAPWRLFLKRKVFSLFSRPALVRVLITNWLHWW